MLPGICRSRPLGPAKPVSAIDEVWEIWVRCHMEYRLLPPADTVRNRPNEVRVRARRWSC